MKNNTNQIKRSCGKCCCTSLENADRLFWQLTIAERTDENEYIKDRPHRGGQ